MRTKPIVTLTQDQSVSFYVERKANFGFYDADFWEIVFPTKGVSELSAEGKKRLMEQGTITFIKPSLKRRITVRGEGSEYVSIRLKEDYIKGVFENFDGASFDAFKGLDMYITELTPAHASDILTAIEYVHVAVDEEKPVLLKKLAYSVFMPLIPFHIYNGAADVTHRALVVMNDPKNISFRLPDVAEKVGCSEEYLVRCFKKSGLETPNTIFKRIKLRYAKSLLTSMKISVSEVATQIGFRSVGHFNKLYNSEYGVCPGADKTRN
ncbi:MAG: helix-turn-helix transcriptional regulator [Clostridia bacterium]|nr:helix-turn-helix transcriptional regulator [Clostridia bacterium]